MYADGREEGMHLSQMCKVLSKIIPKKMTQLCESLNGVIAKITPKFPQRQLLRM